MILVHVETGSPAVVRSNTRKKGRRLLAAALLAPMALIAGCSGLVGQNSSPQTSPQTQTFSISGAISPTAGGSGATVTLSGASAATATADSTGAFSFTGLANGAYTVVPSHAGYTFSPVSQSATVNGANVTSVNFAASVQTGSTYSISGTITPIAGGSGATVTLSGVTTGTATANSSGVYTFTGLKNGTYAVTPSRSGYTFSPSSQAATVNGANVTGLNFTANAQTGSTFSISGTISPVAGGSGATVKLSGAAAATVTANTSGVYTFTGLANGAYTVTPTHSGFTISPASQNTTIIGANITGLNFTASAAVAHSATANWIASTSLVAGYNVYRGTVSGGPYTKLNNSLIAGVSYTDSTVVSGQTYFFVTTAVDGSGNESVFSNEVKAIIP